MAIVVIHIGSPKTGTTAIQNFMAKNRKVLSSFGVVYPAIGHRKGSGHVSFRRGLLREYDKKVENDVRGYEECLNSLKDDDILVISSELLWTVNPKNLVKTYPSLNNHKVTVLCYLRNQVSMIKSHMRQKIKSGKSINSFSEFFIENSHQYDYFSKLKSWGEVFGPKNLRPHVYELESKVSIVESFVSAVLREGRAGVNTSEFQDVLGSVITQSDEKSLSKHVNKSYSDELIAVIQLINSSSYSEDVRAHLRSLVSEARDSIVASKSHDNLIFDVHTQDVIKKFFQDSNKKLINSYLESDYQLGSLLENGWTIGE